MKLRDRLKPLSPAWRREQERDMREELESLATIAGRNELGNITLAMENVRATWGWTRLASVAADIRYALRALGRQPGFAAVAVLSLALAIGANSSMFALADAFLLRPFHIPEASGLYEITNTTADNAFEGMSFPDYREMRDTSRSFSGLAAYRLATVGAATDRAEPARIRQAAIVSGNYFRVVGIEPFLGRGFLPEEAGSPGRPVAMISYEFWREYPPNQAVLGSTLRINGIAFIIIGVTPERFTGLDRFVLPSIYLPLGMTQRLEGAAADPLHDREWRELVVRARLNAGVTRTSAQAELAAIGATLAREYPKTERNRRLAIRTEMERRIQQTPQLAGFVKMLMGLVALILLIACSNVANLLLARARARSREIAIRLSIGAGRTRLVRQLMTESLVVAAIGGAAGLACAYGGILLLQTMSVPSDPPSVLGVELDWRVAGFSMLAALASCVLFGLAPAWQTVRMDVANALKTGGHGSSGGRAPGRDVLVTGQIGLAMVVLIAAGMFLAGFRRTLAMTPDSRIDHVIGMDTAPAMLHYSPRQTQAFYRELRDRVRAMPGVAAVTMTEALPLSPAQTTLAVAPEGYQFPKGREKTIVFGAAVDANYFSTMKVDILRGRAFTDSDRADTRRVAIVNDRFAGKYWPGQDAIGKRIRLDGPNGPAVEVVGVAKTGHYLFVNEAPAPYVYLPYEQNPRMRMTLVAQSAGDPAGLAAPLREAVRAIDANMPVFNLRPVAVLYESRATGTWLQFFDMVGSMAGIGLTLAMTGLYGLIAYTVSRRVKEFGIRAALGASRGNLVWLVERRGLTLAAIGIAVGAALTAAAAPALSASFPGLGAAPPAVYALVPLGLLAVCAMASYLAARRAAALDPLRALRNE